MYLVQNDPMDAYEVVLSDLIRHDEIPDFDQVESLAVAGVDSYEAVYLEENTYTALADDCYFIQNGEDRTFFYGEEELETGDLQSALEGLSAASFTDESPDGKEEIALTITLDNENVQEIRIQLYRYDGEQCLAVVDGQPVSLVPRSSVVDLIEAINAIVL